MHASPFSLSANIVCESPPVLHPSQIEEGRVNDSLIIVQIFEISCLFSGSRMQGVIEDLPGDQVIKLDWL